MRLFISARKVSIPSQLVVTQTAGDENAWAFEYIHPEEPKADGKRALALVRGGAVIDGEAVVERTSLGGALRIVTEKRVRDNDRDALFRYTYTFADSSFTISEEVRPEGASEFFERNRYSWAR